MELEFFRAMCFSNGQEATSDSLLHAYVVRTLLSGLVYFVLILILDTFWTYPAAFWKQIRCQGRSENNYKKQGEATDAALEDGTSQAIYIDGLTKIYQSLWTKLTGRGNKVQALKSIDFSVPEGECVALLGVNGSGKSTTFQVLTACVTPTSGKATVASWDVSSEAIYARDHMGYCPQPNWLFEQLTVYEHLQLVSSFRLRPVSSLESIVSALQLTPVASLRTAKLSGGNKRRVMIAMAVVGQPSVLLLDEPSAGVDVVARRLLWQLLRERTATSCLFTTHCLEESEAVCTSAVVLANGQRVYSGTISHLKQLVSKGLTIQITFKDDLALDIATNGVIDFLGKHVGATRALESFETLVSFEVNRPSDSTVTLADFFELIENSKEILRIERYSISELALDQVFHHLTASS
ncbi:ATP-binding Cassette (ABC) Superfamily [Thraustotheca clavata]|uniref:ATP-binding Cassette (ABC) Superfamily n=1 Tax=Thraustotheca clavata TaxID=74557 RepID=A0A1W0A158_9STRA|nr:ATP-binding Cassette (ABC) Superfamily [Thraustotheca clavata]